MNFGEPEPFHVRRQHFFQGFKFKFEGLSNELQKGYEDYVKLVGAKISNDSPYVMCEKTYAENQPNPDQYYSFEYISDSLEAGRPLELDAYRFSGKSSNSTQKKACCVNSQFIIRNNPPSCAKYYQEHVECQVCGDKRNNDNRKIPSPINYSLSDLEISPKSNKKTETKNPEPHAIPAEASSSNQIENIEESPSLFDLAKQSEINLNKNLISPAQSESDKDSNESAVQNSPADQNKKRPGPQIKIKSIKKLKMSQFEKTSPSKSSQQENDSVVIIDENSIKKEPSVCISLDSLSENKSEDDDSEIGNSQEPKRNQNPTNKKSTADKSPLRNIFKDSQKKTVKKPNQTHVVKRKLTDQPGTSKRFRPNIIDSDSSDGGLNISDVNSDNDDCQVKIKHQINDTDSNDDSDIPYGWWFNVSEHKFSKHAYPKSGRGGTFSLQERQLMIAYLVKYNLIIKAKRRGRDSPWNLMHEDGLLLHRTQESLSNNMRRVILPNIDSYGLPRQIVKQFIEVRDN